MLRSSKIAGVGLSLVALCGLALVPRQAHAQLLGSSILGTLNFGGYGGTNFYEPANGYVPAGHGPQPTAIVIDPGVEFQFADGYSHVDADLTDNTVTLTQYGSNGGTLSGSNSWFISFQNLDSANAFTGAYLIASDVPGATFSLSGDTIILSQPGYAIQAQSVSIKFGLNTVQSSDVPEPGSVALLGTLGVTGLGLLRRKRRAVR